jgi:hypothetical protein
MDEKILYRVYIYKYEFNGFKPFANSGIGIDGENENLKMCLYEFK